MATSRRGIRPARNAARPASTASRIAWAMPTGSRAAASAVFMRIPSTPCSIVTHASEAVPTPASTTTGTLSRRLMVRMPYGFRSPSPLPIGDASGITAAQPASSSQRGHEILVAIGQDLEAVLDEGARRVQQALDVGEEGLLVADDLELDELVEPGFARQAGVAHGVVGREAARGVREQEEPAGIEVMQDPRLLRAIEVDAKIGRASCRERV